MQFPVATSAVQHCLQSDLFGRHGPCIPRFRATKNAGYGSVNAVQKNNMSLLDQITGSFAIPVRSGQASIEVLNREYSRFKDDYSVLIAPLGPKPMILLATLLTVMHPAIGDIKVSSYIEDCQGSP